jgi:hypothetical protein
MRIATPEIRPPELIVAADWGVRWEKRWMAHAVRDSEGSGYVLSHPVPVGASGVFISRLRERLPQQGTALVGFDFPIGLPRQYTERILQGQDFRKILQTLGAEFFTPTNEPILSKPFGPQSAGAGAIGPPALAAKLGIELLRLCDRRSGANPMFYTLGPRQVGRAACDGWQEVIRPNLSEVSLWPFDGGLLDLLSKPGLVLAEIYPAIFFSRGERRRIAKGEGKESGAARRRIFAEYLNEVRRAGVKITLTSSAEEWVDTGFASSDDFDPMLSVLGMLQALRKGASIEPPDDPAVRRVEGWMLGLEAEHREILREALLPAKGKKPLKDLLLAIPPAGEDADFERSSDLGRDVEL